MFAPKPFDVAKEMVRVTRPGGRIVMGNWIPNDPTLVAQILKISSAYSPPPPEGFISPMTWGVEKATWSSDSPRAGVPKETDLLRARHVHVQLPRPAGALVAEFRKYYGPTMNAFEAAEKNGRADRPGEGAGGPVREPEPELQQGRHLHPCDVPAGDGHRLRASFNRCSEQELRAHQAVAPIMSAVFTTRANLYRK